MIYIPILVYIYVDIIQNSKAWVNISMCVNIYILKENIMQEYEMGRLHFYLMFGLASLPICACRRSIFNKQIILSRSKSPICVISVLFHQNIEFVFAMKYFYNNFWVYQFHIHIINRCLALWKTTLGITKTVRRCRVF